MFDDEGVERVKALGLSPAQGMPAELISLVAEDHCAVEEVGVDAAPLCAFAGDPHRIRIGLEDRESRRVERGAPIRMIAKAPIGMQRDPEVLELGE